MLKSAFVLTIAVLGLTASASAPDFQVDQIITGRTVFEKRSTVVPMAICGREPCRKPQTYWSLIIFNDETRYEVNQVFDEGSETPPSQVEIGGIEIVPGALVEIEGKVNPICREYAIVSEIKRAAILEPAEIGPEALETSRLNYNWMCQSVGPDQPRIYVQVRKDMEAPDKGFFYMSVSMSRISDDVSYVPVAEIENARSVEDESRITYSGRNRHVAAELTIQTGNDRMLDLASTLVVTDQARNSYAVSCTRTR